MAARRAIRTPAGTVPVLPMMIMMGGAYVAWFGVHYWRSDTAWPSDPLKAVLTGKPMPTPDRSASEDAIKGIVDSAAAAGVGAGGGVTGPAATSQATGGGQQIASTALRYIGATYVLGGPANRVGNWDCSSFASYVLGHDLGYKLPGGGKWGDPGYPPHSHGPTTYQYLLFGKAVSRSQAAPGDLIVTGEHMGIVVGPNQYVAAKTPALGTNVGSYASSFPGGTPVFRRVV